MAGARDGSRPGFLELMNLLDSRAPRLDVRWEPSPRDVIDGMLKIADVRSGDVLYDLGCGDGRVVIEAARQAGIRATGIDLDPQRIQESKKNAFKAGVNHLVTFRNENLFETDITYATVVTLFLFPNVNLRLRPKLLQEAQPGTRVVSYCHGMDRWRSDRFMKIGRNHVYLWIVPPSVAGQWEGTIETSEGPVPISLNLFQEFQDVTGIMKIGDEVVSIETTPMVGPAFTFAGVSKARDQVMEARLAGSVDGEILRGTAEIETLPYASPWTAHLTARGERRKLRTEGA